MCRIRIRRKKSQKFNQKKSPLKNLQNAEFAPKNQYFLKNKHFKDLWLAKLVITYLKCDLIVFRMVKIHGNLKIVEK